MLLTLLLLAYLAALLWFGLYGNTRDVTLRSLLTTGGTTGVLLADKKSAKFVRMGAPS